MRTIFVSTILVILLGLAGCNVEGEPVEYVNACDLGNDKKTIETRGFLDDAGGLFCSNTSGRMECGFKLKKDLSDEKGFTADVAIGGGANSMDKVESGYQKSDIKVRGNEGAEIDLSKQVTVTGKLTSVKDATDPSGGVCYLKVYKIEQ